MTSTHQVAVITRTKNRPLLLARAMESVAVQTFRDISWVIVNDGGDPSPVDAVAERACSRRVATTVFHNASSLGMESASNIGLRGSSSKFVVIHDDDDSWDPRFLAECVAFLRSRPHYRGVVTQSVRIDETIRDEKIVIDFRKPWNPWLRSIQFADLVKVNQFPPISFLFHREVFDLIGYFDETLPVLGDWDFNLRFLAKFDVGVIPAPLANYHHRTSYGAESTYGNSLYAGFDRHMEYDALIRNRYIRRGLDDGTLHLGALLALGYYHHSSPSERLAAGLATVLGRIGLTKCVRRLFRL